MDPNKEYFCRLSTRSPKDGVTLTPEEKALPTAEVLLVSSFPLSTLTTLILFFVLLGSF